MSSSKTICFLIILFVLVTVSIILSIIAITMSNKASKSKSFAVLEFSGRGTNDFFELTHSTYFNYNVTSDAVLRLSGRKGIIAIINNESNHDITISMSDGMKLKYKREIVEELILSSEKCTAIIWGQDNAARVIRL